MNKLFVLCVIYNTFITDSPTYISLKSYINSKKNHGEIEKIFIIDNSTLSNYSNENKKFMQPTNERIQYISFPNNVGLAKAYNSVLKNINENYYGTVNWLMVTDQDTIIKAELFNSFQGNVNRNKMVGAYVPRMYGENYMISPLKVNKTWWGESFDSPKEIPNGLLKGRYTAINSCSIFNVEILNTIGGFEEEFPIDYLDHFMYYLLSKNNVPIYCLDIDIKHDLSFDSFSKVSFNRYQGFIESQIKYVFKVESANKKKRYAALIHNYYRHARRTLISGKINHFLKGSMIYFKSLNYIKKNTNYK